MTQAPEAWDLPLAEAPFAFVDLEMTGLDPARDRVCEICVLRCQGEREIDALDSLVNPGVSPGASTAIHGIGGEELARAPTFAELAPRVMRLLGGALLVGHAVSFDEAFLRAELGRLGLEPPFVGALDTLTLSRRSFALPSHRLGALAESLGLPLARAHRAGDDARATRALFFRAAAVLAGTTPRDLGHVRVGERHARPEIVALASRAVESGSLVTVRYRPARRPPEELSMVFTALRTDMDPPRVLGYLHPGRGRKELRADRILAILPA